jgi:hypothetical protein
MTRPKPNWNALTLPPLPPAVHAGPGECCSCCVKPMRRWRLADGLTSWDECVSPHCASPPTTASQREAYFQRALDQADKIAKRLGSTWGCAFDGSELPPKPPRMRWRTYRRIEERYEQLQRQGMAGAYAKFLR